MKRGPAPSSQMKSTGIGRRGRPVGAGVLAALVLLALPLLSASPAATAGSAHAFMNGKLADAIAADPSAKYNVIITGGKGRTRASVSDAVAEADQQSDGRVRAHYSVINGMSARMSGAAIKALANNPAIDAITSDAPVAATTSIRPGVTGPTNLQLWPDAAQVSSFDGSPLGADDRDRGLRGRRDAGSRFRRTRRRAGGSRPYERAEHEGHGRVRSRHLRGEHRGGCRRRATPALRPARTSSRSTCSTTRARA